MKTLKQLSEAHNQGIDVQEDAVNYLEVGDLKKYLSVADKFISDDAKYVINWLIDNNATYMSKFVGDNALQSFYNKGIPKDTSLKPLYAAIGRLNKKNRLLEIPVFLSKEQFDGIIDKTINIDDILLDLSTEKGRSAVVEKYNPLVWKIARSFNGKSGLTLDELYSAGLEGLSLESCLSLLSYTLAVLLNVLDTLLRLLSVFSGFSYMLSGLFGLLSLSCMLLNPM